jgi:hypothetical protein
MKNAGKNLEMIISIRRYIKPKNWIEKDRELYRGVNKEKSQRENIMKLEMKVFLKITVMNLTIGY